MSRETLHNVPNTAKVGILSGHERHGLRQLFVYSFKEEIKNNFRVCMGYMDVCAMEMKITLLPTFSYAKSDNLGHRFGCTGSVLDSRFK